MIAKWNGLVTLEMEASNSNLSDYANAEVEKLANKGIQLAEERSYIRQTSSDWQVLTWREDKETVREAINITSDTVYIMVLRADTGEEWNKYEKTFDEMVRSLIVL